MAFDDRLTVVHQETGIIEVLPRVIVEDVYPGVYREATEADLAESRRRAEIEVFGEAITPEPKRKRSGNDTEGDK